MVVVCGCLSVYVATHENSETDNHSMPESVCVRAVGRSDGREKPQIEQ